LSIALYEKKKKKGRVCFGKKKKETHSRKSFGSYHLFCEKIISKICFESYFTDAEKLVSGSSIQKARSCFIDPLSKILYENFKKIFLKHFWKKIIQKSLL